MFEKNKTQKWKMGVTAVCAGSLFVLNGAAAFAAPVELTLNDAVTLALKNNFNIGIYDAARENAAWKIDQAQTGKNVSVAYTFTGQRSRNTYGNIGDSFDNRISASLPLYTGGGAEASIKQAKLNLKVADWEVARTKQQVKLDATTGYFDILQARNVLKVDQESVDQLTAHLKNVQAQYNVGTVAKSDVLQSQVKLANAQQTLTSQKNAYEVAVASLNSVMGLPHDTELEIKEELTYTKYPLPLGDCIQQALQNRPEIIESDLSVESAKQGLIYAESGKKPTLTLSGYTDFNDTKLAGTDHYNWGMQVTAKWSVFDSGLVNSQIKQNDAALTKAQITAKQTRDSVTLAVRQAYLNMTAAEKNIATAKVTVEQAEEDFKIAQVRYGSGVGTNLDVMDAELSLTAAKTNYIQTLYNYNTSKARLEKAIGIAVK